VKYANSKGNPPLHYFPYKQLYTIKGFLPPLSLGTRAVVDTRFFILYSTNGAKEEPVIYEAKWTNSGLFIHKVSRCNYIENNIYCNYILLTLNICGVNFHKRDLYGLQYCLGPIFFYSWVV
jgi:hypothetical protein